MRDIEQFVRNLNKAWRDLRYEDLYEFFHSDVVMLAPGARAPIAGIEAMVQSYRDFGAAGTVHAFDISSVVIYEYAGVSMCHMQFSVDYEVDSGRFSEEGLEVYAIDTSGTAPLVVWRTQIPWKFHDA